jgi:hypothetical protein
MVLDKSTDSIVVWNSHDERAGWHLVNRTHALTIGGFPMNAHIRWTRGPLFLALLLVGALFQSAGRSSFSEDRQQGR